MFVSKIGTNLDNLIEVNNQGICLIDKNLKILSCNDYFSLLFSFDLKKCLGKKLQNFSEIKESPILNSILECKKTEKTYTTFINIKENNILFAVKITPVNDNFLINVINYGVSDSKFSLLNNKFDTLTNLGSRKKLDEDIILFSNNKNISSASFILIDIKNFHILNNTEGTLVGDLCLIELSRRLQNICSSSDYLYRVGIDQFLLISLNVLESGLNKILANIDHCFSLNFEIQKKQHNISPRIGICVINSHEDINDGFKFCEIALLHAKESKLISSLFSKDLISNYSQNTKTEKEFKAAFIKDEFELFLQPQINVKTNTVYGAEFLIRWNHPKFGFLSPIQFIPSAINLGIMKDLDDWVIKKSIKINQLLKSNGININLCVNVSNESLNSISSHYSILEKIKSKDDNSNICFEITESGLLDFEKSKKLINEIRGLDYKIAIDDFGTGYCSLECLLHYTFDYIKIDKTFIDNMFSDNEDTKNQKILLNIIKMGKGLGINLIAEGVETKKQATFLKKHGCNIIQGYHYSKPLCLKDFLNFYHKFNQNI